MDKTDASKSSSSRVVFLPHKQLEKLYLYSETHQIPTQEVVTQALLEYLTRHQHEPGNEWMSETRNNALFRKYILLIALASLLVAQLEQLPDSALAWIAKGEIATQILKPSNGSK